MRLNCACLALICLPLAANAEAITFQPLEQIHAAAADHVISQAQPGTTAGVAPLDPRLRLPVCTQALTAMTTTATVTASNVAVHCAAPEWTVYVPVRTSLRREVVVLRQSVGRGEPLSAAHLGSEEREILGGQGYFSDVSQVLGKILRRPLTPGSVLSPELLAEPILIRRGELVTLLGRAGAMEVRTQARAMGDGSQGQAIQVQNTASGRVISAVVRSAGLVEVTL